MGALTFLCFFYNIFILPAMKLGGYIGFTLSVCLLVRLSVCLSVCRLTFRVHPVASTVQDGFFPYLVQMISSMRGCVTCDDVWPWPISSRSFGLDLENFCPLFNVYSSAWILFIFGANDHYHLRVCGVLRFFHNLKIWIFGKFFKFFGLDLQKNNLQFSMDSFHI